MTAPLLQQQDTVTVARSQVQVMQDHQHRGAAVGEAAHGLQGGVLVQPHPERGHPLIIAR